MFRRLLPNIVTGLNLLVGFAAVRETFTGNLGAATGLILIGVVLDGFDGWLARWLKTTSDFGREFDSLADLVSFGVAPGVLLLHLFPNELLLCFLPLLCAAVRLARFNLCKETCHFRGLPSPAAAVIIVGIILVETIASGHLQVAVISVSGLMISTVPYPRQIQLRILIPVIVGLVVAILPHQLPLVAGTLYAALGVIQAIGRAVLPLLLRAPQARQAVQHQQGAAHQRANQI